MEQIPELNEVISIVVTAVLLFISNKVREYINSHNEEKKEKALRERALRKTAERELLLDKSENVISNALAYTGLDSSRDNKEDIKDEEVVGALEYIRITAPEIRDFFDDKALKFMIKRKFKQIHN